MKQIQIERLVSSYHVEEVITRTVYTIEVEDDFDEEDEDLWEVMAEYVDEVKEPINLEEDGWYQVNDIDRYESYDEMVECLKTDKLDDQTFKVIEPE